MDLVRDDTVDAALVQALGLADGLGLDSAPSAVLDLGLIIDLDVD